MSKMDILNDELLIKLFEWLPSRTRRESRLVCRKWNRICQSYTFAKREEIVFHNAYKRYDLHFMAPLLNFEHRQTLNLRFIDQIFRWTDIETTFWKMYGDRVESINMHDGAFSFIDLMKVLKFCPNLRNIKLVCSRSLQKLLVDFDVFVKSNIIAPSVTTFHLHVHRRRSSLSNYHVVKMLETFPNLTDLELEFKYNARHDLFNENLDISSQEVINLYCMLHFLSGIAKNLQRLHLRGLERYGVCPEATDWLSKLENIKELSLVPSPSFKEEFFVHLKLTELTTLNLAMDSFKLYSVSVFISRVLRQFPRLRHLYLEAIGTLDVDKILMKDLVSSALKTLSLSFRILNFYVNVEQFDSPNVNRKLETVLIRSDIPSNTETCVHLFSILPRYFVNVTDLTVSRPDDRILQHIFKYQERLRKLRLESCIACTDFGFTGVGDIVAAQREQITYCISELSNLEFLQIDPANQITERTFAHFIFPKLKTLKLAQFGHLTMSLYLFGSPMPYLAKFEFLIECSHRLEVLKLDFPKFVRQEELVEMLRPFKQLRYVKISDDQDSLEASVVQRADCLTYNHSKFFQICPSLRKFVHNKRWSYVNIVTNDLVESLYPVET